MRDQKRFAKVMTALMLSAVIASAALTGCSSQGSAAAEETQEVSVQTREDNCRGSGRDRRKRRGRSGKPSERRRHYSQ